MAKAQQKKLLYLTGANEVATSFIGIFFLFFVKENFGLTIWQTVAWLGVLDIVFGIVSYPLNKWGLQHLGLIKMIGLGIVMQALFFLVLALDWTSLWAFMLINILYWLYLSFFWPSYNYITAVATKDQSRGNFLGNLQAVFIGIGLIMPILIGFLFDLGQQNKALWASLLFFALAAYLSQQLAKPADIKPLPWAESWAHLKRIFFHKDRFWGFVPDLGSALLWLWPLYFQLIVGKFVIMGAITSVVALVEIFSAKFIGKLTDKIGAKNMLKTTVWARVADLSLRALYLKFAPIWFVTLIQGAGAILGPLYLIPYGSRLMEIGEEQTTPAQLFDYFMIREIFLGLGRGMLLLVSAGIIYLVGPWSMGIIIAVSGLMALGARKL